MNLPLMDCACVGMICQSHAAQLGVLIQHAVEAAANTQEVVHMHWQCCSGIYVSMHRARFEIGGGIARHRVNIT
jgi:hypothetical protein